MTGASGWLYPLERKATDLSVETISDCGKCCIQTGHGHYSPLLNTWSSMYAWESGQLSAQLGLHRLHTLDPRSTSFLTRKQDSNQSTAQLCGTAFRRTAGRKSSISFAISACGQPHRSLWPRLSFTRDHQEKWCLSALYTLNFSS